MSRLYTEAVYKEQDNGSVVWEGRVYDTSVRTGPVSTHNGIAASRSDAVVAVKQWSNNQLGIEE